VPVRDALDSAVVALEAAGVDTPRLDAEVLLAHVLGVDRARLVIDRERAVEGPAVRAFQDAVRRRSVGREPVAYITGVRGFRRLDLHVDARVLIPRPETETLVEAALALPHGARVVDVGTGSGAVALALKDERPDLDLVATDTSPDALAVARANAARLGLDVALVQGDLLDGVAGAIDAVVSNPPYVEDGAPLMPEIARHEPAVALYAGADGLTVIRRLVAQVAASDARFIALEVGMGQAPDVAAVLRDAGFPDTATHMDLAGIERVVVGRR
jgi:release factor glutamine methyltransferase